MVPPVRHTLLTKALQTAPTGGPSAVNPATLTRPGHIEMDEGRPWSGDLYDYGAVSDPGEAFAQFGDGADVEAWLDMGTDGVIIGWVRDGDAIYRYSDPEVWTIDVDGAGMTRTDGGAASMEGQEVPDGAGDELLEEGEDMLADEVGTADASIGDADPTAFEEEDDDAVAEGDPTEALEDPTDPMVEDATGDGGDDAQDAFADMLTDDTLPPAGAADPADGVAYEEAQDEATVEADTFEQDPAAVEADPTADPAAETGGSPAAPTDVPTPGDASQEVAEAEVEPADDVEDDDEVVTIAPEDLPTADDEDDEDPDDEDDEDDEDEEGKQDRPFERKHMPGEHNQETHGNRVSIGSRKPRASRSPSASDSSGSRSPSATSGGTRPAAASAPAGAPKKVRVSKASIKAMSDKDLDAIMSDGKTYDFETMEAAVNELDERNPLGDDFEAAYAKTAPGSIEEHRMLRDVIPPDWVQWAATGSGRKPTSRKGADREDEWLSFMQSQYLAALAATNGQFFNARHRGKGYSEMGFFDGTYNLQQARRMMSPELKEWWDNHWVTKGEFMAEFSDKAKAALANTKRDDLHA